jgi:hypothetical protein
MRVTPSASFEVIDSQKPDNELFGFHPQIMDTDAHAAGGELFCKRHNYLNSLLL